MRAVTQGDADDDTPVLVSLDHRIAALEKASDKQSSFTRWLIGILFAASTSIAGLAYSAHSQLASRLIEVTRLAEAQIAHVSAQIGRIEERLAAQQQWVERYVRDRDRAER